MKNLLSTIFIFLMSSLVNSQIKIDSTIVRSDLGGPFVSLTLNINDMKRSKADTDNIDDLYKSKNKKSFKPYFYIYFDLYSGRSFYYNRKNNTNVALIDSVYLINNVLNISMHSLENKKKLLIKISSENEMVKVLIIKDNKKYFSKNCKLEKNSYTDKSTN